MMMESAKNLRIHTHTQHILNIVPEWEKKTICVLHSISIYV